MREIKEHQLKGVILKKDYIKHYQGRLKGQGHYLLTVNLTPKTKPIIFDGTIQAIREKILDDKIWDDILTDNFLGKKYLFTCQRYGHKYRLIRWKEETSK